MQRLEGPSSKYESLIIKNLLTGLIESGLVLSGLSFYCLPLLQQSAALSSEIDWVPFTRAFCLILLKLAYLIWVDGSEADFQDTMVYFLPSGKGCSPFIIGY